MRVREDNSDNLFTGRQGELGVSMMQKLFKRYAKKAGLDPQKVFDAIKGGLAGSNVLNAKGPMMIAGNFAPGFRIRLHQKDLRNALLTAGELSVPLPVTALIQQMVGSLVNDGKAESDHSSIANFIEALSKTTIAR